MRIQARALFDGIRSGKIDEKMDTILKDGGSYVSHRLLNKYKTKWMVENNYTPEIDAINRELRYVFKVYFNNDD